MKARLIIYLLLGLIAVLLIQYGGQVARQGLGETAAEADYMNFLLGGAMVAQGHGSAAQLYDIGLQSQVQVAILAPITAHRFHDNVLPFVSVPLVAGLAVPFAALPVAVGFVLWDCLQLAALLLALWLLRPLLAVRWHYLLWLGAFAFLPVYQSFFIGQVSPTLLLGVVLLWRGLRLGGAAEWWGGAGLALLLLKPQLLPLLLLYLLYTRKWQAVGGFTATTAVVYLGSAAIAGWGWLGPYRDILDWLGRNGDQVGGAVMFNLLGLLARLGSLNYTLLLLLSLIVLLVLGYGCWRSDRRTNTSNLVGKLELQLAATVTAAIITSLHLYAHDLTLLIFSVAVLLGWAAQRGWPVWAVALLLAILITPLTFYAGAPLDSSFIAVMLLLLLALVYAASSPATAKRGAFVSLTSNTKQ